MVWSSSHRHRSEALSGACPAWRGPSATQSLSSTINDSAGSSCGEVARISRFAGSGLPTGKLTAVVSGSVIQKVDANGIISTVVGNGSSSYGAESILATNSPLSRPYEPAFCPDGTIFVTESGSSRVRQVDRNGIITTVAGNGSSGFGGDGGYATNARLSNPGGVAIDLTGNLYIADTGNRRVRKVTYPIRPTLAVSGLLSCSTTSLTLTAKPAGSGFTYQFSPGATQIGSTNQVIISTGGTYSVTVSTSLFGSPAGQTSIKVSGNGFYTIKPGNWNDPSV